MKRTSVARRGSGPDPNYCRKCDGAGGTATAGVRYYADGSAEPDLWEACEGCVAVGGCPWCRSMLFVKWEESGLYRCSQSLKCGWNEIDSERVPLAAWECVCWEAQQETGYEDD